MITFNIINVQIFPMLFGSTVITNQRRELTVITNQRRDLTVITNQRRYLSGSGI
jgi:hypothetical protein